MDHYIERVVELLDPSSNRILNMSVEDARQRVLSGDPQAVREIDGSFALIARNGRSVRLARSMDRPMRYFLAKRQEGPALVVADRIDAIHAWLRSEGFESQFHPGYTRMVPAHYIVELQLIGCPDPSYTRFFTPQRNTLPTDPDEIGRAYIGALPTRSPDGCARCRNVSRLGCASRAALTAERCLSRPITRWGSLGMNPARLKAFTLSFGEGPDLDQARQFLDQLGLGLFLEPVEASLDDLDVAEIIRVVEDYKPIDIEAASMGLTLCRGIRRRYPDNR